MNIRKGQSEALNGKKTNNAMNKRKKDKGKKGQRVKQLFTTLHRKLKN